MYDFSFVETALLICVTLLLKFLDIIININTFVNQEMVNPEI